VLAPNVAWNATHGFATLHHTAANAAWNGVQLFNLAAMAPSWARSSGCSGRSAGRADRGRGAGRAPPQPGVRRPAPALLHPAAAADRHRPGFISRANANWSGAGYLAGAVLVAAWLIRWRRRAG
jgi:hypothetical protein